MADTLPNVFLPANTWVDLYAATGIPVGTQIVVTHDSASDVNLTTKATEPTSADGFQVLKRSQDRINDAGDSGAWAISPVTDGLLNVRVFV